MFEKLKRLVFGPHQHIRKEEYKDTVELTAKQPDFEKKESYHVVGDVYQVVCDDCGEILQEGVARESVHRKYLDGSEEPCEDYPDIEYLQDEGT